MVQTKLFSRIKAAVVGAAMIATTLVTPAMTNVGNVTAATKEIKELPYTFVADGVTDGGRQGNIALNAAQKKAKSLTLNFTTDCTVDATIAVYGYGTTVAPDYWANADDTFSSEGKSEFSITVDVPTAIQGKINKIGVGIWYPKDKSEFTLTSIDADGVADPGTDPDNPTKPDPIDPNIPGTENDKSGTYTFKDNNDGTATITATLSAQYREDLSDPESTSFDYLLTQGIDDYSYAPYKDKETGEVLPVWKEGDPINSRKFMFKNFGIDDLSTIKFQSFQYTIQSDSYNMDEIQYGGGINVAKGSPADTESVKGNDGYWYNDMGEEDLAAYEAALAESGSEGVNVHGAWTAEGCGSYADVTWDVPQDVAPYVDFSNSNNAVGFQFWYGTDSSAESTDADGNELPYTEIPEIHLTGCIATYTREMTVPYNTTVSKKPAVTLASGKTAKLDLSELAMGKRDKLSAVKFTFDNASEFTKFICAPGISVDENLAAAGVADGWFQGGDITVINNGPKAEVMWIIPEAIRDGIYADKGGNIQIGFWYAGNGADEIKSTTLSAVDYYVYRSTEEDIVIKGEDGLEVPDEIQMTVGDEYQLDVNVPGAEFSSDREKVATVDDSGLIKAIDEGLAHIKIITPEGQEKDITVKVSPAETTTTVATTVTTTTTTVTTTTTTATTPKPFDPNNDIDWTKVHWGDVNLDGEVTLSDVVMLSKFLVNSEIFPLKNATSRENANCEYDDELNSLDNAKLIEYNLGTLSEDDLGPQDPEIRLKAAYYLNQVESGKK